MARQVRSNFAGAVYHVMTRGNQELKDREGVSPGKQEFTLIDGPDIGLPHGAQSSDRVRWGGVSRDESRQPGPGHLSG